LKAETAEWQNIRQQKLVHNQERIDLENEV
jgi:hypothetical protein